MPASSRTLATSSSISLLLTILISALPAAAQKDASFSVKKTSTKVYATATVTADLNGDGIPDLIEPYARLTSNVLFSVQLGLGSGYFAAPVNYNYNLNHQNGDIVLSADVNRDGKADVIFITGSDQLVFLGNGDGTLQPAIHSTLPSTAGYAVVGDFNRDGNPDLVIYLAGVNTLIKELGTGTGTFQAPLMIASFSQSQGVEAMAVGDFDGDANLDVALGLYNQPCNEGGCASDDVHIFYGDGTAAFLDQLVYAGIPGDITFGAGDLNNDGRSDITAHLDSPNSNGDQTLVLYGEPGRTVNATFIATTGYYTFAAPQPVVDVNGDGLNDLVVKMSSSTGPNYDQQLGLLLRNANDSFTLQAIDFGALPPPDQGNFLAGDFNRDGQPDLLFSASDNSDSIFNIFDYLNTTGIGVHTRCEYPAAAAGITRCIYRSGTNGSTVSIGAAANWFEPLRKMEFWLDGKKTLEQYNVWDKYAWLMSTPTAYSNGTHKVDLYSAGYDNVLQHQSFSFTVPGATCKAPGLPGINVCSPTGGTVSSPVEALAAGDISGTIQRMEVWVDGVKEYSTYSSNMLDATLAVSSGAHTFTFYIVNTGGQEISKSVSVTVK